MPILIGRVSDLTREQWLDHRRKGIGGSDIAGIAGISPWATPMRVYLDKVGEGYPQEETEAMYWGNVMEDIIAQEFSRRTGMKVRKSNTMLVSSEHDWMLANIDRDIVGKRTALECKNVSAFAAGDWADNKCPDYYQLQCQWYMMVTGYPSWWIAALIGGSKFVHFEIQENKEIQGYLFDIAGPFWQGVLNQTPPKAEEGDGKLLDMLFPAEGVIQETKVVPPMDSLFNEYTKACELEKFALAAKEKTVNQIKEITGQYAKLESGSYRVSWTPFNKTMVNTEALKAAGLFEKYSQTKQYRRFTIKKLKEES